MGWCSGTRVFDEVVSALLENKELKDTIDQIVDALEDMDWDCHSESEYWDHPVVQSVMRKRHPDWFDDEDE